MMPEILPRVNYDFVPRNGENVFRKEFGSLSDQEWCQLLIRSIDEPVISGIQFPTFPDKELQNVIHGQFGAAALSEATTFFHYIKKNTYKDIGNIKEKHLLDFGSGWGRIVRLFMRDFEFRNLYGFEPNFLYCAIARSLNPYVNFLSGEFTPTGNLPREFFDLAIGYSIFSHLSPHSAVLWLEEISRALVPGGYGVFTTWGRRFFDRLKRESQRQAEGHEIHWYTELCLKTAGSIDQRIAEYEGGEFVWFTSGKSNLYGEAFISESALLRLISENRLPFVLEKFDKTSLAQDVFIIRRL